MKLFQIFLNWMNKIVIPDIQIIHSYNSVLIFKYLFEIIHFFILINKYFEH